MQMHTINVTCIYKYERMNDDSKYIRASHTKVDMFIKRNRLPQSNSPSIDMKNSTELIHT